MEKLGFFNGVYFLFLISATYNDGSLGLGRCVYTCIWLFNLTLPIGDVRTMVSVIRSDAGMLWLNIGIGHGIVGGRGSG